MSFTHGIKFISINTNEEKHSYNDFGLVLSEQDIGTPTPKTYTVNVGGMNGLLDLTEALDEVKYNNRNLTFKFSCAEDLSSWETRKTDVANFLHGLKMKIITWSDPNYYYVGRCTVDEYNSSRALGVIVVSCNCEPFKYHHEVKTVALVEGDNIVENSRMVTFADLNCTQQTTINDTVYSSGNYVKVIKLASGTNTIKSTGTATLTFREGEL